MEGKLKICLSAICLLFWIQYSGSGCQGTSDRNANRITSDQPNSALNFQNEAHKIVYEMVQKVGNMDKLRSKQDVVYTNTYQMPNGNQDISLEKYIFDGELSYGQYDIHQRTFPNLEGTIEQGYDGVEYWLKQRGQILEDKELLDGVAFKRPTNFYWFAMFQKLLDPGLVYEHLGEKIIENELYDVVSVSFLSSTDNPTDIYQLYIHKETKLVDQFLFTVVDKGVMDEPLLMQLEYERIEDLLIPTKRRYKKSTWEAEISNKPWIEVTWTNIKFNVGLTLADFKK